MAEKRLIDANAVRNALYDADSITMKGVAIINQFPTVDAVEVVRCRNCERFEPLHIRPYLGSCEEWDTVVSETGYCHRAERRADETDHSR